MTTIDWYFDFISPFAYLQHEHLHRLPAGVELHYRPVLLAGLLGHWGSKGPAEIPGKRVFTYRHVTWLAHHVGVPFTMPTAHPFNPLKLLRLAIALDCQPDAVREIFRFVWRDGHLPDDTDALHALAGRLGVTDFEAAINAPAVKDALRRNTEEAAAREVFGVPTAYVNGELFWGFDATDMLLDYLADPGLLATPEMQRVSRLPAAAQRV